jgi:NAD(P)H-dependent flavin oxidoreductase YrpB (nitropropane dioxygenase family)
VTTPVCEMLGIGQPIVQAPMAAIPGLAAAVSNAGALGMVTLTWSDDAGAVVRETAALTARPFGGNLVLADDQHRRLDAALEAGLRIVSFMWGDPSGYVKEVHDARGVAAVLALGAQAAWLGTRFLLATEMPIHEDYRRALIAAAETDPQLYPNLYEVGWPDSPHRALRNSTATAWEAAGRPPLARRPGAGDVIAHFASGEAIVRYEPAPPMAGTTGEIEALSMWAGQGVALARKSQSAADIVAELTSRL